MKRKTPLPTLQLVFDVFEFKMHLYGDINLCKVKFESRIAK